MEIKWRCEACKIRGEFDIFFWASAQEVFDAVLKEHKKKSESCNGADFRHFGATVE